MKWVFERKKKEDRYDDNNNNNYVFGNVFKILKR